MQVHVNASYVIFILHMRVSFILSYNQEKYKISNNNKCHYSYISKKIIKFSETPVIKYPH